MNIPGLPTDNLYKFMALTGIVLIISGYVVVWPQAMRSQELSRELKQLGVSAQALKGEADILHARARRLVIEEELKLIFELQSTFMTFFHASQIVGVILAVVGSFLWYTRLQKYQDLILKKQATQKQ
jgi:hypothetical protein